MACGGVITLTLEAARGRKAPHSRESLNYSPISCMGQENTEYHEGDVDKEWDSFTARVASNLT